ncbi:MAG: hypothetical protein IT434_00860 [Phycisphaerales bacterium]|nr:hypothetical protein [Phycisphaerales bacterium]
MTRLRSTSEILDITVYEMTPVDELRLFAQLVSEFGALADMTHDATGLAAPKHLSVFRLPLIGDCRYTRDPLKSGLLTVAVQFSFGQLPENLRSDGGQRLSIALQRATSGINCAGWRFGLEGGSLLFAGRSRDFIMWDSGGKGRAGLDLSGIRL